MNIKFHLGDDILLKYAAGTLDEASGLLVATHLALCPHCRARNRAADALGGALLDSLEAAPLPDSAMDAVLARLRDEPQTESAPLCVIPYVNCRLPITSAGG